MLGEGEFSVIVSSAGGDVAGGGAGEGRVGAVATEVVVAGASGVATREVSGEMLVDGEFSVIVSSAGGDVVGGERVGAVATEVVVVGVSGVATCEVSDGSDVVLGV